MSSWLSHKRKKKRKEKNYWKRLPPPQRLRFSPRHQCYQLGVVKHSWHCWLTGPSWSRSVPVWVSWCWESADKIKWCVTCKDSNLESSDPVTASRSHKDSFTHVRYLRLTSAADDVTCVSPEGDINIHFPPIPSAGSTVHITHTIQDLTQANSTGVCT